MKPNRILIVDFMAVAHLVKYGMMKTRIPEEDKGSFIIYGFFLKLNFLLKKTRANQVVFALDSKTSKRKEIYSPYKEKRKQNKTEKQIELDRLAYPQFEKLTDYILPEIGYRNLFSAEGFEADDIIGKICKKYKNDEIIICSADQDFYQLLTKKVCMLNPRTNNYYTIADFKKEYKIKPKIWKRIKSTGGCFDKKTDILTDRGWVKFPNIKKTDKVYSMDPITRKASYEKITKRIKYIYKGEMYKIKGTLIDLLVTPNHKFFGSTTQAYPTKDSKNIVSFKEIQEIVKYKNYTIPITSSDYNGVRKDKFILPGIIIKWEVDCKKKGKYKTSRTFDSVEIDMDVWVAFLGIYLADGHVSKNRNGNLGTIGISANKKRKLDYFTPILNATPWNWWRGKTGWGTDNVQLASYLKQLGKAKEKFIPREFLNLHTEQLQILFNSLISGDGCVSTRHKTCFGNKCTSKRVSYYSSSKKLIDNVQEVAIKLGHSTRIIKRKGREWHIRGKSGMSSTNYNLKINKSNNTNLKEKIITKIPFNDFVYDVTTEPYHTILVRRNGSVVWSSNCKSDNVQGIPIPQNDPKKKQMHVGEKTALNYYTGKLKPTSKAFQAIESRAGKDVANRNKALVILPFKNTPEYTIRPDHLKLKKFTNICKEFGFVSILEDINSWKKTLKLR